MNTGMTTGRKLLLFVGIPLLIIIVIVAVVMMSRNGIARDESAATTSTVSKQGFDPWGYKCIIKEEGFKALTHSPMDIATLETIAPYGLTAGGHVTPIDHMYFYPYETPGDRFSAKVYAVADGVITLIQHRGNAVDQPGTAKPGTDEYRFTIEQTCNQGYYYDLITQLSPDIKAKVGTFKPMESKNLKITVKAGDLLGYVGNQSLDFGVYDTTVNLNFIVPEHYQHESWKIHTADPYKYFTPDIVASLMPKIIRTVEPIAGKIDYDKDGYLIGNWFEQGTKGYGGKSGNGGPDYWDGHLAFLYDAYDPSLVIVSVGRFKGKDPQAFSVKNNTPDPGTINQASGLIKYELMGNMPLYTLPDGSKWDRRTRKEGVTAKPSVEPAGIMLVQLTADRTLKMEVFPGKTASEVTAFTAAARTYER